MELKQNEKIYVNSKNESDIYRSNQHFSIKSMKNSFYSSKQLLSAPDKSISKK